LASRGYGECGGQDGEDVNEGNAIELMKHLAKCHVLWHDQKPNYSI